MLMYADRMVMPHSLQKKKKILKVSHNLSEYVSIEILDEELYVLATH